MKTYMTVEEKAKTIVIVGGDIPHVRNFMYSAHTPSTKSRLQGGTVNDTLVPANRPKGNNSFRHQCGVAGVPGAAVKRAKRKAEKKARKQSRK